MSGGRNGHRQEVTETKRRALGASERERGQEKAPQGVGWGKAWPGLAPQRATTHCLQVHFNSEVLLFLPGNKPR